MEEPADEGGRNGNTEDGLAGTDVGVDGAELEMCSEASSCRGSMSVSRRSPRGRRGEGQSPFKISSTLSRMASLPTVIGGMASPSSCTGSTSSQAPPGGSLEVLAVISPLASVTAVPGGGGIAPSVNVLDAAKGGRTC